MNTIQQAVERQNLGEAISYFSVVVHRDAAGHVIPTVTIFAEDGDATEADRREFHEHLSAIAALLRKAYGAPA